MNHLKLRIYLGVQIYLAPTVDDRDVWLSTMRTIALEGRCFVISACQYLTSEAFPEKHVVRKGKQEVLISGGSCAVSPMGEVILEPHYNGEKISVIECDLTEIIGAKLDLDAVGHYSRPDIFQLVVNEKEQNPMSIQK